MPAWPNGWWIMVRETTRAITLGIQSGASKDGEQIWTNWHQGMADRLPLPTEQQDFKRLFVEVVNPEEEHVEVDILYNGQLRQSFNFDNTHEWYDIDAG